MKLELTGHNYQYAAEQIMTVLFPGEKPVYGPVGPEDEDWARIRLSVGGTWAVAVTVLHRAGKETRGESRVRACRLEDITVSPCGVREGYLHSKIWKEESLS